MEIKGKNFIAVNNDCVEETAKMAENSVDLIVTSIPFSNHYEYTPSYNDFGHNEDTRRFFEQMDYLTPNLLRVLKPGRVFCCHVKDRVLFGNATGMGMPTMEPFHAMCIRHYMQHGFAYFGMITVVTDVVRENNQTYRLGWTEREALAPTFANWLGHCRNALSRVRTHKRDSHRRCNVIHQPPARRCGGWRISSGFRMSSGRGLNRFCRRIRVVCRGSMTVGCSPGLSML